MFKRFLISAFLCLPMTAFAVHRVDLLQAFADAARFDPVYLEQTAQYKMAAEQVPESLAPILPQISLTASIDRERQRTSTLKGGYFNTKDYGITASQTIFNFAQFKQLAQAKYAVRSAFETLSSQQQDLMIRTAEAYFAVLRTRDLLNYTIKQKRFITRQLHATKERYDHKDATITELDQSQGAYDLIRSELYTARINFYSAVQSLSEITSKRYQHFAFLNPRFPLVTPKPQKLSAWLAIAGHQNLRLRASKLNDMADRQELKVQQAGYLPTVTANASFNNARRPNNALTKTQNEQVGSYGVSLDWKLSQGGLTMAQVRKAEANLDAGYAFDRGIYLNVMANARKAYNGIVVGAMRVRSARRALASNESALRHSEEGYKAGDQTVTDVLQTQSRLFQAQKQYVQDVYAYLIDILRLKQAAGTLSVGSLASLNHYL